ncbi:unnamed protein product [Nesidiocoris tenuis]|uniref:Phospholipase A-2-activating protein n=1 Tax=Nesidiocoris tenuis TaxID=355587 RepID=A0A6H5HL79_9HEMI|nr:unnamed protein product [Nesidiocoris tenuis]
MPYKLSYTLPKHDRDVRALKLSKNGKHLLSGSRDNTANLWRCGNNNQFELVVTLRGHKHFVTTVEFVPPSPSYARGLVATGSNDKKVCIYSLQDPSSEPLVTLEGHQGAISSLCAANAEILLSASWDGTVRLWNVSNFECTNTYEVGSKEKPPWAVIYLESGVLVVASADTAVKVLSLDAAIGSKELKGHTDCVRGLVAVDERRFMSCGNDAMIIKWDSLTGEKLEMLSGHPNFIYNISLNGGVLASAGEDGCALVWKNNQSETILHPATSVWSVAVMGNGDVITGASDGYIRIFTPDESRMATPEELTHYADCVTRVLTKPPSEQDTKNVPGIEGLAVPGRSHDEIKMIREDDGVNCYQWDAQSSQWNKIGQVMGAANKSGKPSELEKAYDYTFPVDIEDGKPPLKLYYNKGQDPYVVAQAFIHAHNLPQDYLEIVAKHIIKNVGALQPAPTFNPAYQDPFTGSSAYDPDASPAAATKFYPITNYVLMETADLSKIRPKLADHLITMERPEVVTDEYVDKLIALGKTDSVPDPETVAKLREMLCWPSNMIFPVLDLTRLAVRIKDVNRSLCCQGDPSDRLMAILRNHLVEENQINAMMSLRIMANMVCHEDGGALMVANAHVIYDLVSNVASKERAKGFQVATATLVLNMAVLFAKKGDQNGVKTTMVLAENLLQKTTDSQALMRLLVAIGTCLAKVRGVLSPQSCDVIKRLANSGDDQVTQCSRQILTEIQAS